MQKGLKKTILIRLRDVKCGIYNFYIYLLNFQYYVTIKNFVRNNAQNLATKLVTDSFCCQTMNMARLILTFAVMLHKWLENKRE